MLLFCAGHAAAANGIEDLGPRLYPTGLSGNGSVVVGSDTLSSPGQALRWSRDTGFVNINTLNNEQSAAYAVDAAGDVVVGDVNIGGNQTAFRWTSAGMAPLGTLGGNFSTARAVNAGGDVVVGYSNTSSLQYLAFRWTSQTGMVALGVLNPGGISIANGVNAAGDVVVGSASVVDGSQRAFRWTLASNTMTNLGTLGGDYSFAFAVNAAGDAVVGYSADTNGVARAFRWTLASGSMVSLGALAGGGDSYGYATDASGNVVVGSAAYAPAASGYRAFRWTPATGMQTVEQWLAAAGVAVSGSASPTYQALGVSADGSVVMGTLENSDLFLARVAPIGSGLMDVANFNASLVTAGAAVPALPMRDADLVVHGAHGNPLRGLLSVGRSSLWTAGDVGVDHRDGVDGHEGVGELGWARRLSEAWQLQAAIGRSYSQNNFDLGGETKLTGTYLAPEGIAKLSDSLYVTLSGYYNDGSTDVRRGYLNAGAQDYSAGRAGVHTLGARVRLDWLDAFRLGDARLTPYTSLTSTRARVAGYTEGGGGFPVRWDARTEISNVLRAGTDAVWSLAGTTRLLGRLEGDMRLERDGAAATGEILGLGAFSLPGQRYRRAWLRTGAGAEGSMGAGTAFLMLNATTEGGAPAAWLAASWRVNF